MIITWGDRHLRYLPKFDFYIRISNFLCDELNLYYQACVTVLRSYLIGTVKLFKLKVSSNVKSKNLPGSMVKSSWWLNWPVLELVELFFLLLFSHLIPHLKLHSFAMWGLPSSLSGSAPTPTIILPAMDHDGVTAYGCAVWVEVVLVEIRTCPKRDSNLGPYAFHTALDSCYVVHWTAWPPQPVWLSCFW